MIRHTISRDRWDVADWERTRTEMPGLKAVSDRLESVSWTAPNGLADVYQLLARPRPQVLDVAAVEPAFRPNHRVVTALAETDIVDRLRHHTAGDRVAAGSAAMSMEDDMAALYTQIAGTQEKADDAQRRTDEYRDACGEAGVEPGSAEARDDDALEQMREMAVSADVELTDALDRLDPVIAQQARHAVESAAEEADDTARAVAGWDLSPAEIRSMDPSARLALMRRLNTDRMRRISELVGRLRTDLNAVTSRRWDQGPDEIADITLGNDLNRLLTSELLGLCDDDMAVDFLDRYDRGRLLQYKTRRRVNESRGGIVYVEDSSTSMFSPDDAPALWARSLGLVLLDVAVRQRRAFRAVVFAGSDIREFDFGVDASTSSVEERVAYAEFEMGGGTSFEGPLDRAAQIVTELAEAGADVVFATDGTAKVSADWLVSWRGRKATAGFRCFGITIGMDPFESIEQVSDFVAPVYELHNGQDVARVFRAVTGRKMEVPA